MAALTDITLSDKSSGNSGQLAESSREDPLKFLQKKVALTAKIARAGQPVKSYAKMMFIVGIKGGNEVRLGEKASDD